MVEENTPAEQEAFLWKPKNHFNKVLLTLNFCIMHDTNSGEKKRNWALISRFSRDLLLPHLSSIVLSDIFMKNEKMTLTPNPLTNNAHMWQIHEMYISHEVHWERITLTIFKFLPSQVSNIQFSKVLSAVSANEKFLKTLNGFWIFIVDDPIVIIQSDTLLQFTPSNVLLITLAPA